MNAKTTLVKTATLIALGLCSLSGAYADQDVSNPWLVRGRAVELNWANAQNSGLAGSGYNVQAKNVAIPEFDATYFFTKNIATELVLTYPQKVNIKINGAYNGSLKALPPSLIVQYHFTDFGAIKPYVGVGANYTSFTSQSIDGGGATVKNSSTGAVAQLGVDYMLDKNWGLNFDIKYIQIKTDVFVGSTKEGQLGLNPTAAALGVTYRF